MAIKLASREAKARSIPRLTADYFVILNRKEHGSIKITELWDLFWKGMISHSSYYWTHPLPQWVPLSKLYYSGGLNDLPDFHSTHTSSPISLGGFIRSSAKKCSYCLGPAIPRYYESRCHGIFCRQCLQEICDTLKVNKEGCPICLKQTIITVK